MSGADLNKTAYVSIIFLYIFLNSFNNNSYGQGKTSGAIQDNKNSPNVRTTIPIKNLNRATLSNSNGNFPIAAKNSDTMIISSVGMEEIQIQLFNQKISGSFILFLDPGARILI